MAENNFSIDTLISEEEIDKKVRELGAQISKDYAGKKVSLICILKGSTFFSCELAKRITVPVEMEYMRCSSYGNESTSSGVVKIIQDLDEPIHGKNVIIVEDIIDTGRTLAYLKKLLEDRNPESIKLCTLLDKPDRRTVEGVEVDYRGFIIPDEFVVGYGLDYAQQYRNLPYIGVVKFDK